MTGFISAKEAAARWGVNIRMVQQYCSGGRVEGARKCGVSWVLPAGAEKPTDPRRAAGRSKGGLSRSLITTMPLQKHSAGAELPPLPEKLRPLAEADLAYRRGDPNPAKEYWRKTGDADETKLTAASLGVAAAIASGDYELYYEIASFLVKSAEQSDDEREKALLLLPTATAAVSTIAPDMTPLWLKRCDFSLFPQELTPFLVYLYTLHLRNVGDSGGMLFTARTASLLCAQTNTFTWLDLYFKILCAAASFALNDAEMAEKYLLDALELGMPYGLIMPFGEYFGEFGGMLARLIEQRYPQQLAPIKRIWGQIFKNWMSFHNEFTKENITTILTAQEYQAARLITRGATYAETARQMNLSVGRINNIMADVFGKLYIKNRRQLQKLLP